MNKISGSIYSDHILTIPMAEVDYVKQCYPDSLPGSDKFEGYEVVFKSGSRVRMHPGQGKSFLQAWCHYRFEVENLEGNG